MYLKFKIVLLSIVPVALALAFVTYLVQHQAEQLVEEQVKALEARVVSEKKSELENYIELAITSIEPFLNEEFASVEQEAAISQQIKLILENMTFTEDGYFFAYQTDGTNVLHPKQPWRVGENWWNVEDANGVFIIQELISAAQSGGGFVQYLWERPTTGEVARKISYAVAIDRFDWMIGTGVYLDEIDGLVAALRADVEARVHSFFFAISIVFAACVVLVGAFISALAYRETSFANTALRRLYNKLVDVQEDERARVSRDLHDSISQILVSSKFEVALAKSRVEKDPERGVEKLDDAMARIDDAITEVRRISADLRPKDLDDLGLAAALRSLGERFENTTGLKTSVNATPVNDLIGPDQKSALYRIAQEGLTNIQRHASASTVDIALTRDASKVRLSIVDDGVGIADMLDTRGNSIQGMGLRNMEERLASLSGRLMLGAGNGTHLTAEIPIVQDKANWMSGLPRRREMS